MGNEHDELAELSASLRGQLARAHRAGRTALHDAALRGALDAPPPRAVEPEAARSPDPVPGPAARPAPRAKAAPSPKPETPRSGAGKSGAGKKLPRIEPEPESPDRAERMEALLVVGTEAAACTRCGLCKTRIQVAFSRGSARNAVMFVGEAPGAEEDRMGQPFVGRAGKLLDQMMDAIGLDREAVYVANILKCRPPNNRDPLPEEIEACTPYLERQIELIQPKVICALGRFAAQFLTGQPKAAMGKLRGRVHLYQDRIPVVPTYHPAALLRNPHWKKPAWEDVQLLRREYLR